jgi:hypothetical protein
MVRMENVQIVDWNKNSCCGDETDNIPSSETADRKFFSDFRNSP